MGYDEFDLAHGRSIASEKMDSFVRKTAEMLEGKKFNNVKSAVKALENYCIFRAIRLKKYISQECLHQIREIYMFSTTTQNREEFVSIILN